MDSSQKLTNTDVKKLNKNRIFRLIYNSDKISRQEIADQLGLSLPTVNQNLKMLMEDGLIEYVGNFTSTGGRRAQAITINNNARKAISVNIKADYINVDTKTALLEVKDSSFLVKGDGEPYELPFEYGFVCLGMRAQGQLYQNLTEEFSSEDVEIMNIGDSQRARRIIDGTQEGRNILTILEQKGYL